MAMRTRFESRASVLGYNLTRDANIYRSVVTQVAWNEWQIAWNAAREESTVAPIPPITDSFPRMGSWAGLLEKAKDKPNLTQTHGLPPGFAD